jgi:hypothetical protein
MRNTHQLRRWAITILLVTGLLAVLSGSAAAGLRPSSPSLPTRATCTADEQTANQAALATYVKRMARDRTAYFRKHHDNAHRKAFVKKQQAKLKALQAAAACQVATPPPTPPPPPPYQSGHYAGKSSQLTDFEFDVSADGTILQNLVTGQINMSCNGFDLYGDYISASGNLASISSDGNFAIRHDEGGTLSDGTVYLFHVEISGHLAGTSATGTLLATLNFTYQGTAASCTSNPQTWSASKTG